MDDVDASPDEDLFRLMAETWPKRFVFLPFDDPIFSESSVGMNWEEIVYVAPPKRHYDATFILPTAHRIAIPQGPEPRIDTDRRDSTCSPRAEAQCHTR